MNLTQSYSPIGKFIFHTRQNPHVLDDNTSLQKHLNKLIDTLKRSIDDHGFENTQNKLEDEFFTLRFEILEYLNTHPEILDDFETMIIEQIGSKYFTSGKLKELGHTVSDTLEVYLSMFGNFAVELKKNLSDIKPIPADIKQNLTLSALKHINSLQPNPEFNIVIEWFSASVKYDFYLIVAELIFNKEIEIHEKEMKQLIKLIKQAIVDFGTYTVLSGLWIPNTEDESRLARNIKIRVAAHNLNNGSGKNISLHSLQNLLLS